MLKHKTIRHNNTDIKLSAESFVERIPQSNEKSFYILVKASDKDFSLVQLGARKNMDKHSLEKVCEMALSQAEADLKSGGYKEYHFA